MSALTKGMCMPVSEPCIDGRIKHMINKINSTSPLLATQKPAIKVWGDGSRGGPVVAAKVSDSFFIYLFIYLSVRITVAACIESVRWLNSK